MCRSQFAPEDTILGPNYKWIDYQRREIFLAPGDVCFPDSERIKSGHSGGWGVPLVVWRPMGLGIGIVFVRVYETNLSHNFIQLWLTLFFGLRGGLCRETGCIRS